MNGNLVLLDVILCFQESLTKCIKAELDARTHVR